MQEIEDPELATKRTRSLYQAKGYCADWIEKRMCGITIRDELTASAEFKFYPHQLIHWLTYPLPVVSSSKGMKA